MGRIRRLWRKCKLLGCRSLSFPTESLIIAHRIFFRAGSNEQFRMYYPITLNILDWIISMCLLIVVLQSDTYIVGNWHAEAIEEFEEGKIVNETKFWFTA